MKHSTLLRRAKKHLKKEEFVCLAINEAAWVSKDYKRNSLKAMEIKNQICEAIKPYHSVKCWLRGQGFDPTNEQMVEYRHRWLDELIRIYEEAGK